MGRLMPGGEVRGHKIGYDGGSWATRLVLRTIYVLACALVACLLPFFGYLMGLFGALAITPTTFLLPSLLWLLMERPRRWRLEWAANWLIVVATGIIGVMGAIGSAYLIVVNARDFRLFAV